MFRSRTFAPLMLAAVAAYGTGALAENGVAAGRILIGQSASLTGTTAEVGRQMRDGALAYLETVNRQGGINGRKIELLTLDDAGQTKVGAANTPFFGAATGGESIHGAFNRNVFNVRASYTLETQALVNHLVATGQTKIGMIYHKDDLKKSNLKMTEDAAAVHRVKLMGSAAVDRNSTDVKDAVAVMGKLNPDAVICNAAVKPLGEFVRQMRKAGATSQFLSVSFVGSPIVKELGSEAAGVIMAQVVPLPTKVRISVVAEYQKALANVDSKAEYSFSGLEGFITAKVLVEGLRRTGKDLTRPKFIRAMEAIRDLDVGDYFVSYSQTNHNGSKYVDITVINRDGRFFN